jgi:hypothetical protein
MAKTRKAGPSARPAKRADDAAASHPPKSPPPLKEFVAHGGHRESSQRYEREQSAAQKNVEIPQLSPELRAKREELERDDAAWLRFFFDRPDMFWYDFVPQQRQMIRAIARAIEFGGDQALAASRGEGKTKISERMLLKYTLQGKLSFSVLFAATGSKAIDSLRSIKDEVESNDLLCQYYPEICVPVRALQNTPNRAHYQTVSGYRHDNGERFERQSSKFTWCGAEIYFPNVPGAPAARAIIATRGLDSEVRGLNKLNQRPQLAVIDDPDTEETVNSEEQAKKLEERIDRGIAGLGSQRRPVARVMITTLQRRDCVSAWYTDPSRKHSFKGRRYRFLARAPDRQDLWEEYISLWRANLQARDENGEFIDEHARGAHRYFLEHFDAMVAGGEVANPHRFNPRRLEDGTQLEVCALQSYYNLVARYGPEAVQTEYDNDPPEESGPIESGITARRIQKRLSGYPQRIVPPGCTVLVQGMDIKKPGGHWVVRAWRPDCTGFTIDYGFHESHGTTYGSEDGVEAAVMRVILERMEYVRENPYLDVEGHAVPVALTLVDSGWKSQAVYDACARAGLGILPSKGIGRSNGCIQPNFHDVWKRTPDRKPGDGWFMTRQSGRVWLVNCDTDRWKSFEHERWMTSIEKPGAFSVFGVVPGTEGRLSDDERCHHSYAHHLVAEVEVEEEIKGRIIRHFKAKSTRNHYLDASYLTCVAANMKGIVLPTARGTASLGAKLPPNSRPSIAQVAGRK